MPSFYRIVGASKWYKGSSRTNETKRAMQNMRAVGVQVERVSQSKTPSQTTQGRPVYFNTSSRRFRVSQISEAPTLLTSDDDSAGDVVPVLSEAERLKYDALYKPEEVGDFRRRHAIIEKIVRSSKRDTDASARRPFKHNVWLNQDIWRAGDDKFVLPYQGYIQMRSLNDARNTTIMTIRFTQDGKMADEYLLKKLFETYINPHIIRTRSYAQVFSDVRYCQYVGEWNDTLQRNIRVKVDQWSVMRHTKVVDERTRGFRLLDYSHFFKKQSPKPGVDIALKDTIIVVRFNQKPRGGWLPKHLRGKRNRNLHEIVNNDLMCGQRALVIAQKYSNITCVKKARQSVKDMLKKRGEKVFRKKAIKMSTMLGLSTKHRMTVTDFTKYCDMFKERIVIIIDAKDRTTYDCAHELPTSTRTHYLLFVVQPGVGGHYHYVTNHQAYLRGVDNDRRKYYCHHCMKTIPLYKKSTHKCKVPTCWCCGTVFDSEEALKEHKNSKTAVARGGKKCVHCDFRCYSAECHAKHEAQCSNSITEVNVDTFADGQLECESERKHHGIIKCGDELFAAKGCKVFKLCCRGQPEKGWCRRVDDHKHKCDHAYCKQCDEYLPREHRCILQGERQNNKNAHGEFEEGTHTDNVGRWGVWDVETYPDENHEVSHCHVCMDDGQIIRWAGADALEEFAIWALAQKKTTFWAHNSKGYDAQLLYAHLNKNCTKRPSKLIFAGQKIMMLKYRSTKFCDSMNHIMGALANMPKTFNLKGMRKGFFPYRFNKKANAAYVGPMPAKHYFSPETMKGKKQKEFNVWYASREGTTWNHNKETILYCDDDVRILQQALHAYQKTSMDALGIDPLKSCTVASYCRRVWNVHHYDKEKYPLAVLTKDEYDFIHRGFYGGRTETFMTRRTWSEEELADGKGGKYVDICSLYPGVQYYDEMPYGTPEWKEYVQASAQNNESTIRQRFGYYEVDVCPPKDLIIPVLMARENGKLVGTLHNKEKVVVHQRELITAIEKGYKITRIYRCLHFKTTDKMFRSYIDYFHKTKLNSSKKPDATALANCGYENYDAWVAECEKRFGFTPTPEYNAGARSLSKLCLNNLWGKFAMRPGLPQSVWYANTQKDSFKYFKLLDRAARGEIIILTQMDDDQKQLFVSYKNTEQAVDTATLQVTNIALAASVTSNARCRLYEVLGSLGERAMYCDTDSVIYEHDPTKWNPQEGIFLGEWTDECDGKLLRDFVSVGAKAYSYILTSGKSDCKSKGITLHQANADIVNFKGYCDLVSGKKKELTTTNNMRFILKKGVMTTRYDYPKRVGLTSDKRTFMTPDQSLPFGYEQK